MNELREVEPIRKTYEPVGLGGIVRPAKRLAHPNTPCEVTVRKNPGRFYGTFETYRRE